MKRNPDAPRRSKPRKQAPLPVLIKNWNRASVDYNRDCNLRCPIDSRDPRNRKLMNASTRAFNIMFKELKRVLGSGT